MEAIFDMEASNPRLVMTGDFHEGDKEVFQSNAMFGLYYEEPTIFFLYKFWKEGQKSTSGLIGDSPFSIHLVSPERRSLPVPPGAILIIEMFRKNKSRVDLRLVLLPPTFNSAFNMMISKQLAIPWDVRKHDETINRVYDQKTTDEMFTLSPVIVMVNPNDWLHGA